MAPERCDAGHRIVDPGIWIGPEVPVAVHSQTMRKQHSPTVKAQLVLEMLQELRPVTQVAAEYGIAPRLLHRWRKEAVDHVPDLFADPAARGAARQAEQVEAL